MWLSQLGKTIQPSDVLFNLTKFSNTISVGIEGLSVKAEIFPVKMNHGEINKSLGLNNELTKRVDFFLKQIGV